MNNKKLSISTRLMLLICGLNLIAVLYAPIWKIELNAPQYPEGLALKIHADDIKGDVEIINGLNHYIGMKTLHKTDFPEFQILPYCILFFVAIFILTSLVNRKWLLYINFLFFLSFGILAMADFWKWEYDYGHNLNPDAAIIVPGMAYQPPLIGFKQLLNFGAYSIPDTGGWIFVASGILLMIFVFKEWWTGKKASRNFKVMMPVLLSVFFLNGCKQGPEPIKVGVDPCSFCKMTISDPRFGAELVTSTGRSYKFDDIQCLKSYLPSLEQDVMSKSKIYFTDFSGAHALIPAESSLLLKGSEVNCPMEGDLIAFSNSDSMKKIQKTHKGEQTQWSLNQN